MTPVFRSHTIICGWGSRAKTIVSALRQLTNRPIVILYSDAEVVLREIDSYQDVFIVQGDPADPDLLRSVDVTEAFSVLVIADETIANYSDARSVEIALSVERIQSAVSTVVELRDIRNKVNFSWTKVDDLVTSEHIAVCMFAQGIRHAMDSGDSDSTDRQVLSSYVQLIDPHHTQTQIFRVNVARTRIAHRTFDFILERGLALGVVPVALVGFAKHELADTNTSTKRWASWKADINSMPPRDKAIADFWPEWPQSHSQVGILVLAKSYSDAVRLAGALG